MLSLFLRDEIFERGIRKGSEKKKIEENKNFSRYRKITRIQIPEEGYKNGKHPRR